MKVKHAIGFAGKAAHVVAHAAVTGEIHVTKELKAERLKACGLCALNVTERCEDCGCPVESKASYVISACPLNNWKKY